MLTNVIALVGGLDPDSREAEEEWERGAANTIYDQENHHV